MSGGDSRELSRHGIDENQGQACGGQRLEPHSGALLGLPCSVCCLSSALAVCLLLWPLPPTLVHDWLFQILHF